MCLAVPSEIVEIDGLIATIDVMGVRKKISLMLLPEEAEVGDYVLVHAGFAIQKVQKDVALESLRLLREMAEKLQQEKQDLE
jgi:hydrogenase expression/formation protein HypC